MSGVSLALVSGANRGIGLEVARSLARDGYRVLAGTRSLDAMGDVGGLDITPVELDVTDPGSIAQIPFEPLEVLVNNAGIYPPGRASEIDFDVVEETWQVNALGAWRLAVAAIPHMGRGARIVNVSSGAGSLESMDATYPAYNVSKAAMNAITRVLAADLRAAGILVNSVCPGWVRTDMGGASASRSVEEGAAGVLWAARLGPDGPTGGFFRDGNPVPW
jgi:NAD(P)-dependent dehydrogenase (short-subunit alcohol dehydrogenase family)